MTKVLFVIMTCANIDLFHIPLNLNNLISALNRLFKNTSSLIVNYRLLAC